MARLMLVLSIVSWCTSTSWADKDTEAAAKHYEAGMAHYHLEEYDRAIAEWEEGFRVKPVPEFLFNIAQAMRLAKRPERAVAFYQKYLRMAPDSPNRAEVERHIEALTKLIKEQPAVATPTQSVVTPAAAIAQAKPAHQPVTRKRWFWGIIGGAAVLAVGGIVTGVVLGLRSDSTRTIPGIQF